MAVRRRRTTRRRGTRDAVRFAARPPLAVVAVLGAALMLVGYAEIRAWLAVPDRPHLRPLSRDEARALNAATPFVGPLVPARPFVFHGTPAARLQAEECLATAALYEAGDDERGQKAVIQVVLNRVAQPGFPKTVCGVVYQGAARTTGCQFSFACDGSRQRRTEHAGWPAARARARRALSGHVFAAVGTATHYHTDWVVPWWSGSLDKIAQVSTHIFYRPRS